MESAQKIADRIIVTHKSGVENPFIENGHLSEDFVLFVMALYNEIKLPEHKLTFCD